MVCLMAFICTYVVLLEPFFHSYLFSLILCFRVKDLFRQTSDSNSVFSSRTKPASTSVCVRQCVGLNDHRMNDTLQNQLGDAVTFFYFKRCVRVIEQDDTDIATVVLVDDTGTNVDEILPCQSRAWCDAAVCAFGHFDLYVRLHQLLATCRDNRIVCTIREIFIDC